VGEVAAGIDLHREDPVAELQQAEVGGEVGVGARERLDVGVLGAEHPARPLPRQRLEPIDVLEPPVVAFAGVALAVDAGEHRAQRLHRGLGRVVLRGDQVQRFLVAEHLLADEPIDLRVEIRQLPFEQIPCRLHPLTLPSPA
jgi:hypothetical protein